MVRLSAERVLSRPLGRWDSEAMIVEICGSRMETVRQTGCAEEPEPICGRLGGHFAMTQPRVNGQSCLSDGKRRIQRGANYLQSTDRPAFGCPEVVPAIVER